MYRLVRIYDTQYISNDSYKSRAKCNVTMLGPTCLYDMVVLIPFDIKARAKCHVTMLCPTCSYYTVIFALIYTKIMSKQNQMINNLH